MKGRSSAAAFLALAFFVLAAPCMFGAWAQSPTDDAAFYGRVAEQYAARTAPDQVVDWSSGGRSGTIQFGASARPGCRSFEMNERGQPGRTFGEVCASGAGYAAANVQTRRAGGNVEAGAPGPGGASRGLPGPGAAGGASRGLPPPTPAPPKAERPPSMAREEDAPRQASASPRPVRPFIVTLSRTQERIDRSGGHAIVLLTHPASLTPAQQARLQTRNGLLCAALLEHFEESTYARTEVGFQKEKSGQIVAIRPVFWPLRQATARTGSRCSQLIGAYDVDRAAAILDNMEFHDVGPYLVVSPDDQRQAYTINMTALTDRQIRPMVTYFRDRISQKEDVWSPRVMTAQVTRTGLIDTFGNLFTSNLTATVRLFDVSELNPLKRACIGDTFDARCRR